MKNEILLIPEKSDTERDLVASTWVEKGGEVLRIGKFWERPNIHSQRVTIYGNDTFSLVLAQILELKLMLPKDEIIGEIDIKWTKRQVDVLAISEGSASLFPTFIKPVNPKTFTSKIYKNYHDFLQETDGIQPEEKIIQSDIVSIDSEVRAFVLNGEILDSAVYEGSADLREATEFLNDFLADVPTHLPKSSVVDAGHHHSLGWFIIEFNASWGAGLNSCDPRKVIQGIREATINEQ